jgi:hypothetical protein
MHRRAAIAVVTLAPVSLLLALQFAELIGLTRRTGTGVPGFELLLGLTVVAGFGALVGTTATVRAARHLIPARSFATARD